MIRRRSDRVFVGTREEKLAALKAAREAKGKKIEDSEAARLKMAEQVAKRREEVG